MAVVFGPYRPREGYPIVPRWLMIVLLIIAAAVWITFTALVGHDPTSGPPSPPGS
jgi:hypothetical protein